MPLSVKIAGMTETEIERAARLIADLETRLQTDVAVLSSIVCGTEPDSPDGRRARRMLDVLRQMLEGLGGDGT